MSANSVTDSNTDAGPDSDSEQSSNGAYSSLLVEKKCVHCTVENMGFSGSFDSMQYGENGPNRKDTVEQHEMRQFRLWKLTGNINPLQKCYLYESMKNCPRVKVYNAWNGEQIGVAVAERPGDLSFPPQHTVSQLMAHWGHFARQATQEEFEAFGKWFTIMWDFKPTAMMLDDNLVDHTTEKYRYLPLGKVTKRITLIGGRQEQE